METRKDLILYDLACIIKKKFYLFMKEYPGWYKGVDWEEPGMSYRFELQTNRAIAGIEKYLNENWPGFIDMPDRPQPGGGFTMHTPEFKQRLIRLGKYFNHAVSGSMLEEYYEVLKNVAEQDLDDAITKLIFERRPIPEEFPSIQELEKET